MNKISIALLTATLVAGCGLQAQEIKKRQENQQDRIAQGVASGKLTPKETIKLEKKEAAINKEIRTDRKANGGNLTNKEKAQVNRQLNKTSKQIYKEKHDQPGK